MKDSDKKDGKKKDNFMKGFSLVILSFLVLLAVFSLGAEVGALITSNVIQSFDFTQNDNSLSSGLTNQGNEITHLSLNKTGEEYAVNPKTKILKIKNN